MPLVRSRRHNAAHPHRRRCLEQSEVEEHCLRLERPLPMATHPTLLLRHVPHRMRRQPWRSALSAARLVARSAALRGLRTRVEIRAGRIADLKTDLESGQMQSSLPVLPRRRTLMKERSMRNRAMQMPPFSTRHARPAATWLKPRQGHAARAQPHVRSPRAVRHSPRCTAEGEQAKPECLHWATPRQT